MEFVKTPGPQGLMRDLETPGGHELREEELAVCHVKGQPWQIVVEALMPVTVDGRTWNTFTPVAVIDIDRLTLADPRFGYPVILRVSATVHDWPAEAGSVTPQACAPVQP